MSTWHEGACSHIRYLRPHVHAMRKPGKRPAPRLLPFVPYPVCVRLHGRHSRNTRPSRDELNPWLNHESTRPPIGSEASRRTVRHSHGRPCSLWGHAARAPCTDTPAARSQPPSYTSMEGCGLYLGASSLCRSADSAHLTSSNVQPASSLSTIFLRVLGRRFSWNSTRDT